MDKLTLDKVDAAAEQHMPLCMRHLHKGLRTDAHLKHQGRLGAHRSITVPTRVYFEFAVGVPRRGGMDALVPGWHLVPHHGRGDGAALRAYRDETLSARASATYFAVNSDKEEQLVCGLFSRLLACMPTREIDASDSKHEEV